MIVATSLLTLFALSWSGYAIDESTQKGDHDADIFGCEPWQAWADGRCRDCDDIRYGTEHCISCVYHRHVDENNTVYFENKCSGCSTNYKPENGMCVLMSPEELKIQRWIQTAFVILIACTLIGIFGFVIIYAIAKECCGK